MNRPARIALAVLLMAASLPALAAAQGMAPAAPAAAPAGPPPPPPVFTGPGRPPADLARDSLRKPQETIAFAGVKPGMTVAELSPGGGYYTRLLSAAVGPRGKVLAVVSQGQAARPNGLAALNALVAANPNVQIVVSDYTALTLPEKADLIWTTENYHDFHNGAAANIPALNKAVFDNLKPGGIFYVEDHAAAPGAGLAATSSLHRMDEAVAKAELAAAGFRVDAESQILRNPADNKVGRNSEVGSFASDRFMLRMKRP
jgi:predicted methyltransferase